MLLQSAFFLIQFILVDFPAASCGAVVYMNESMPQLVDASAYDCNATIKPVISILASVNYGGVTSTCGPICTKVMEFALIRLKQLPNYELAFEMVDDQCLDATSIGNFVQAMERSLIRNDNLKRIPVSLLPACNSAGQMAAAALVKRYGYVAITANTADIQIEKNRDTYANAFGLISHPGLPYIARVQLAVHFGWQKVAIISEIYPFFTEMERYVIAELDRNNVTLLWMGKMMYQSTNPDEFESTFLEMKARDPRIIMQHTNSPVVISCYLYRFGMYGPNYVIFSSVWSYYDPWIVAIPPFVSSWCTREMLARVLPSWIFFGYASFRDSKFVDSVGTNASSIDLFLRSNIVGADKSPAWFTWPQIFYDQAVFAGLVVNATEAILQTTRNESILNWTTNSDNFRQHSSIIIEAVKQAVYSLNVQGFRGDYHFDSATTINSLGYTPIIISVVTESPSAANHPRLFQKQLYAYYKSNEKISRRIVRFSDGPVSIWRTADGLPPRDSARIILSEQPPTSLATYAALAGIASLIIGVSFVTCWTFCRKVHFRKNFFLSMEDLAELAGVVVMVSHVFAIPLSASKLLILTSCTAQGFLLISGFSLTTAAKLLKLSRAHQDLANFLNAANQPRNRRHRFRLAKAFNVASNLSVKNSQNALLVIWVVLHLSLFVAFVGTSPLEVVRLETAVDLGLQMTVVTKEFHNECRMNLTKTASSILLAVMGILHLIVLLLTALTAYEIRATSTGNLVKKDVKMACNCVYCECLVFITAALVIVLQNNDNQRIQIALSSSVIAFSVLVLAWLIVGKKSNNMEAQGARLTLGTTKSKSTHSMPNMERCAESCT